jgi:hypothetical protein
MMVMISDPVFEMRINPIYLLKPRVLIEPPTAWEEGPVISDPGVLMFRVLGLPRIVLVDPQ